MCIKISFCVPENQRVRAAIIFYEAFETKFRKVFGSKNKGVLIIARHLQNDRTVVATSGGIVIGIAGLEFKLKGFIDVSFWQLMWELGSGALMVILSGCFYIIFRKIWVFLSRPGEKEIVLDALAVAENMRGKGIGNSLLSFVIDFGRSNGYKQIRLFVSDRNVRAKRLYERVGFIEIRVRRILFPWNRLLGFNTTREMVYRI